MDAVKYLRELDRMCSAHKDCDGCPILDCGKIGCGVSDSAPIELVDTVEIVEKWAKEHPVETRQSRFLKEFPNTSIYVDGTIDICPLYMDETIECKAWGDVVKERDVVKECIECEREFWGTEV